MMPTQQGQFVTIAPNAGVTAHGVGYGVLLNGVASPNGERMSIDDATRQLVEEMQQNNGLQPVSDTRPINVSDIQGCSVMLQSSSPFPSANGQPQKEQDWLVTFPQRDGSFIFMVFVAPQSDFARLKSTYEAMLKSVQFR
jgi:hypothetical protein